MKSEAEIREKLECYETMLAAMEAGQSIGNPDIFLTLSQHFPGEVMELLGSEVRAEMLIQRMPPEDRPWVRQWFSSLAAFARQVLETRIGILGWVLDNEENDGVTNREGI
jgi:DNA-binding GntR family transcriptional regulator